MPSAAPALRPPETDASSRPGLRERLRALDARVRAGHEVAALAIALAVFALLGALEAARQTYPFFDDVTYLDLGHEVRALGGPVGLLGALLRAAWEESNRHPLYLALLGLVARPGPGYHRAAQALTLGLGAVALLACWWTARRHLGRAVALGVALLLPASRWFVSCAAREGCEPLLVVVWALALGAILDGLEPGRPRATWAWVRAGLWSGLAFLTKGTGMFLPASLALTFLAQERLRALVDRRAWAYAAGFLATSWPLLVRNVRRFGTPLYNWNTHMLWQDRLPDFAETNAPQAKALPVQTLAGYLRHLTPRALLERVGVGAGETTFLSADVMSPAGGTPGPNPLYIALVLVGAAATVVALRRIWRMRRGFARTFLLVHAGWSWFFIFVFSVNGGNTRYFLPLAATVLVPALAVVAAEDVVAAGSLRASRWARRLAGVAVVAVTAALLLHPPRLEKPGMDGVRAWLEAHVRPGEAYAVDARSHFQPHWVLPGTRQVLVSASWQQRPVEAGLVVEHLRQQGVRWVILDASSTANMAAPGDPAGRRYLFYDRMPLEADGSLPLAGIPEGLSPAYVDPGSPRRWLVLETPWGAASRR